MTAGGATAESGGVPVGVVAPDSASEVARLEAAGAASLWVGGHIASRNPSPEAMVWLARLIEMTTVPVGTAVLLLPLYPPPLVAKQIADLDRASGGRLTLGVGVGGEYASDFDAVGVPMSERGSRTNEAIGLLRQFWTAEPVTHTGRHFGYDALRIHPAPTQPGGPPIVVSGRKDPAMRRAAALGDGWMPYLYSASAYARSVARIRELADEAGRDLAGYRWLSYVAVSMDADGAVARRRAADFLGGTYQQDFDQLVDRIAVVGDPDEVGEKLQAIVDAGARHLVLLPCAQEGRTALAERLLTEVTPGLRLPVE